ncbi:MAG: hypothetical protein RLZZ516_352 [Cyanobacteriota bacterium]
MPRPPVVIEAAQGFHVVHVLAAVEQLADALRIDLQRSHLLPEALGHGRIGQLELSRCQLSHQQEHQLLFLALTEAAVEGLSHRCRCPLTLPDPLLLPPLPVAKPHRPATLDWQSAAVSVRDPMAEWPPPPPRPPLAAPGSEQRWQQLQRLRRGVQPLQPWIEALGAGLIPADADLLAALWGHLDGEVLRSLLASPAAAQAEPWLTAGRLELPALATRPELERIWLEPLLWRQAEAATAAVLGATPDLTGEPDAWLRLLGHFRSPAVAERLRLRLGAALEQGLSPAALTPLAPLLPLLGQQRDPGDLALLLRCAQEPGPSPWRRAALEGVAVGLAAWPQEPLLQGLLPLCRDLDAALAAAAVDLLARLPQARRPLRQLLTEALDPAVRRRLQRRLRLTPLVLLVHGRSGGAIPEELRALAAELQVRRGTPVLLQALTAEPPIPDPQFWSVAARAGGLSLVPLLLLPGGHVRHDLPAIAAAWRQNPQSAGLRLRRLPFLGAWPVWQAAVAAALSRAAAEAQATPLWLHHPLEGPLAARFLSHLAAVLPGSARAAPYTAPPDQLRAQLPGPAVLLPLTLAANRLSESLLPSAPSGAAPDPAAAHVLPPLLEIPAVRQTLITALEQLP